MDHRLELVARRRRALLSESSPLQLGMNGWKEMGSLVMDEVVVGCGRA